GIPGARFADQFRSGSPDWYAVFVKDVRSVRVEFVAVLRDGFPASRADFRWRFKFHRFSFAFLESFPWPHVERSFTSCARFVSPKLGNFGSGHGTNFRFRMCGGTSLPSR